MTTVPELMHPTSRGFYHRDDCRLCNSRNVELAVHIRPTPIADHYIPAERLHETQNYYPLDLYLCRDCGHVQLLDVVDPEVLFRDYIYVTSISKSLVEHFRTYADEMIRRSGAVPASLVVDIGSNDGSLLRFFQAGGMRVLGVDPARDIATQATRSGIPTVADFFTPELARRLQREHGQAAIVTANNVFAHADDLGGMADGIREMLAPDGIFVFEVSYLVDIVDRFLFDTVYHEHLCYHSVAPLRRFFRRHGMELVEVERLPNKGGSIRGTAQRAGGPRRVSSAVLELLALEENMGLGRPELYQRFDRQIARRKEEVLSVVDGVRASGKRLVGFGASATVTTLLHQFELGTRLEYLVDDNSMRHGLFSPGYHLPVRSPAVLSDDRPDAVIILAWQYADPIMRAHHAFLERGGTFIVPLPVVQQIEGAS